MVFMKKFKYNLILEKASNISKNILQFFNL